MLPTAALDLLKFDRADAEEMAARGEARAGYEVLVSGRERAVAAREAGYSWAEELTHRYDETMREFAQRHGLSGAADDLMT